MLGGGVVLLKAALFIWRDLSGEIRRQQVDQISLMNLQTCKFFADLNERSAFQMQQMAPPQALPSRLCSVLGSAAPGTQGGSALCILSLCITSISRGFGIAFVKSYLFVNLTAQGCCGVGFHFSGITRSLEMANAPFPSNRHGHGLALQSPFYRILGHKTKMTPVDASCPDSLESGRFHL